MMALDYTTLNIQDMNGEGTFDDTDSSKYTGWRYCPFVSVRKSTTFVISVLLLACIAQPGYRCGPVQYRAVPLSTEVLP